MRKNVFFACTVSVCGLLLGARLGAEEVRKGKAPPALKSIFPLGANQGSHFSATVRGENLDGAYHVWFDCQSLSAEIEGIREIEANDEEDPYLPATGDTEKLEKKLFELRLRVIVEEAADLGAHEMRLVTPLGVTDALSLLVDSVPVVLETDQSHAILPQAQHLELPALVNARLAESGEVDYYSFDVEAGQALQLEVRTTYFPDLTKSGDPQLVLFKPEGSWFDPHRGVRLEVTDLWRPPPGNFAQITNHRLPRVRRVFNESGRYLARVDTVGGQSGPDYSYQLKIFDVDRKKKPDQQRWGPLFSVHKGSKVGLSGHDFSDPLGTDRMQLLWARSGSIAPSPGPIEVAGETEPNDLAASALKIPVPSILQGVIDTPHDADWFQFEAKSGDRLAFEIETPYLPPPFFNPRFALFDSDGRELASNVYRELGGDGDDWIKTLAPKILHTFDSSGNFLIQVRDLTSRVGGGEFSYRFVVRPQIPHVGKVVAEKVDRIHLASGESESVGVTVELEEGFEGDVALSIENLPLGVSAAAALRAGDKSRRPSGKRGGQLHRERHFPRRSSLAIMLIASGDVPATTSPQPVTLMARPISEGRIGDPLPAQTILLTRAAEEARIAKMEESR